MSGLAFSEPHPLGAAPPPSPDIIKKMLLENQELIKTIYSYQKEGKVTECFPLQKVLHRNLVYLATLADANVKMDAVMTSELSGAAGRPGAGMMTMTTPSKAGESSMNVAPASFSTPMATSISTTS